MPVFYEESVSDQKRLSLWVIAVSSIVFLLITLDMIGDYKNGVAWRHLITEVVILVFSLMGIVFFGRLLYQSANAKIHLLERDLASARQQAQEWREANHELISGLAVQIQKQFDTWELTRAEAEVGLLMMKGLSFTEIAGLRGTSERTIRDQARAIYRKSGVAGRTELSAFFLEDLLLPREE